MPRFEYTTEVITSMVGRDKLRVDNLEDVLRKYGDEGWELASLTLDADGTGICSFSSAASSRPRRRGIRGSAARLGVSERLAGRVQPRAAAVGHRAAFGRRPAGYAVAADRALERRCPHPDLLGGRRNPRTMCGCIPYRQQHGQGFVRLRRREVRGDFRALHPAGFLCHRGCPWPGRVPMGQRPHLERRKWGLGPMARPLRPA